MNLPAVAPDAAPTPGELNRIAKELCEHDERLDHFTPSEIEKRLECFVRRLRAVGPQGKGAENVTTR